MIELMIVVAIIGILAAIAVPNFTRFQVRSRQSEAKLNLKAIFSVIKSHAAEHIDYECGLCGFSPELGYRYNYYVTSTIGITDGKFGCTESKGGVTGAAQLNPNITSGESGGFTASAVGNIDSDDVCDGWNIDDANNLRNPQNDVTK